MVLTLKITSIVYLNTDFSHDFLTQKSIAQKIILTQKYAIPYLNL
jgi:hypothetical protein